MIKSFEDILAWQKAHQLTLEVYRLTEKYPKHETFGITSQTRRSGVSVPSNIAEGFRRNGQADSLHFYNIAQASLEELRYQLLLARDLGYVSKQEFEKVSIQATEASKTLNGWVNSQKK